MNTGGAKATESARKLGKPFPGKRRKATRVKNWDERIEVRKKIRYGEKEAENSARHFAFSVGFRIFTVSHGKGISRLSQGSVWRAVG